MTQKTNKAWTAIAVEGRLLANVHIVDFLVEHDDGFALLPSIIDQRERVRTQEQLDDLIATGHATRLSGSVSVGGDACGLLINPAISQLLDGTDSNPLAAHEEQAKTTSGELVVVDELERLKNLRKELAEHIVRQTKEVIIAKIQGEIEQNTREELPDWRELESWTDYAIDSGAGGFEYQFQAVLLRCWLLQRGVRSTEVRNFWKGFLQDKMSWEELEGEIRSLEVAIRSCVERKSWRDHQRWFQEYRIRQSVSVFASALETEYVDVDTEERGGHPRQHLH